MNVLSLSAGYHDRHGHAFAASRSNRSILDDQALCTRLAFREHDLPDLLAPYGKVGSNVFSVAYR